MFGRDSLQLICYETTLTGPGISPEWAWVYLLELAPLRAFGSRCDTEQRRNRDEAKCPRALLDTITGYLNGNLFE